MPTPTILSHLTRRFAAHPENIATEALAFILRRSAELRASVAGFLKTVGVNIPADLRFETQSTNEEGSRPDLIGADRDGQPRLIIEAKFWAGLTDAQPVGYLRALAPGATLLFLTPSARVDTVWAHLLRRVGKAGMSVGTCTTTSGGRFALVDDKLLAIASWRSLLGVLEASADASANHAAAADIRQLSSLCDGMDSEAFLPLTSDELTSNLGRRIIQFGNLAISLQNRLVDLKLASVRGMRATGGNGSYGRSMLLRKHGCAINFSAWRWAHWGDSPLWLDVKGPNWKPSGDVRAALDEARISYRDSPTDGCLVPLYLLSSVERDEVLDDLTRQAVVVASALPTVPEGTVVPLPPPDAQADDEGAASAEPGSD